MQKKNFVAYYRVSTDKQAASGLGLAAQKKSVNDYICRVGGQLVCEYQEAQSGKLENTANRIEFARAIETAKRKKATLIVAKLDRLARCCSVLERLQMAQVKFIVAEMPEANELTLGLLMVVAKNERDMCSQRTKAALAAKKAQGAKLGAAREGAHIFTKEDAETGHKRNKEKARNNTNSRKAWIFLQTLPAGTSTRKAAAQLMVNGYLTPTGRMNWSSQQVLELKKRMTTPAK